MMVRSVDVSSTENWRRAILHPQGTIKDAINVLISASLRSVLVVGSNGILEGTVSDGDIRRGLLRGLELTSSIQEVLHRNALVVTPGINREIVLNLMTANKIQQIPIVDREQRVIGLHLWDDVNALIARTNLMVIMAGGKGSRLLPQTEDCPKPLLPVAGRPILEHIIMRGKAEGFTHFVISVNYLAHMIENYFGDGERFGVDIQYLREASPLGTAGSLSLFATIPSNSIIVTNGDVITDIHYGELLDFHNDQNVTATMAVRLHEWQNPFGVVQLEGMEIKSYEEKPIVRSYINAGVYVLDPSILSYLEVGKPCDMPDLLEKASQSGNRIAAYPAHEHWLDVGRPEDLKEANSAQ